MKTKIAITILSVLFFPACFCPVVPGTCRADDCGIPAGVCDASSGEYPLLCTPEEVAIDHLSCEDSGIDACGMRVWCCTNAAPEPDCATTAVFRNACKNAGQPDHYGFPAVCESTYVIAGDPPTEQWTPKTADCTEVDMMGALVACCP